MQLEPLSQLSQQFERGFMCDASESKYCSRYFLFDQNTFIKSLINVGGKYQWIAKL